MSTSVLYAPQLGAEHRRQIERIKAARNNMTPPVKEVVRPLPQDEESVEAGPSVTAEHPSADASAAQEEPERIRVDRNVIIRAACAVLADGKIGITTIISRGKPWSIVRVRQVVCYLMRHDITVDGKPMSWHNIASQLKKHHTTIIHSCRQVAKRIANDPQFAASIAEIRSRYQ